jgi:hypothetical protein
MKFQITLERLVKATIEETYEVDCEEQELELYKKLILDEAEQGGTYENYSVEIVNTLLVDWYDDNSATKPKIICVTKK